MKTPKNTRSVSKAPTNAAAPDAAVHSEQSAVATLTGAAANPPDLSVSGGSTNTRGESGDAAGTVSTAPVQPMASAEQTDAAQANAATPPDAGVPPGEEASASGTNSIHTPEGSAETAEVGGGDPAASAASASSESTLDGPQADVADLWPSDEEALKQAFPLTHALFSTSVLSSFQSGSVPKIRVTSKENGFRRGGVAYSKEPTDYLPGEIDPARLEMLLAEPMLAVNIV